MMHEHGSAGGTPASLDGSTKKPTWQINAELAEIAAELREERAANYAPPAWDGLYPTHDAGRLVRMTCENWRAIRAHHETGALYTPIDPGNAPRRAVLITQTRNRQQPPRQCGDRWTDRLTHAAAVKIENAAKYSHRMGRGFRTFATLTLTEDAREQLRAWDFQDRHENTSEAGPINPAWRRSLGAMVADFLKTVKMAWQRGQVLRAPVVGEHGPQQPHRVGVLRPHAGPLVFAWVAECPLNAAGEPNPHVHLMMNWQVSKKHFRAWAAWIEKLWPGFVNLTKLRKTASAAAYMAKAAQYMTKGAASGQGFIRGNRYGIAAEARAPAPRTIGVYFADFLADAARLLSRAKGAAAEQLKRAGIWASAYAFGARTRAAWGRIWTALKRDGFTFDPAPPNLLNVRTHNARVLWQREQDAERAAWHAERAALCDDSWRDLLRYPPPPEGMTWAH